MKRQPGPAISQAPQPSPPQSLPIGRLPRDVRPLAYTLELEIIPSRDRFAGRTQIRVELAQPSARIYLHGKGLAMRSARAQVGASSVSARYAQVNDDGLAQLDFAEPLPAGQVVLELVYDAPFDRQLSGLYKVETSGAAYAFTQFEPVSARIAFPCFDEPAFKTPFDVWLTVPSDHAAISNGPELGTELSPAGVKRVHFAQTLPLPTYLVAFAVGPFDVVQAAPIPPNAVRAQPLPLRGVAVRGKGPQLEYALANTAPLLHELERYFGIPFPYPKLDLIAVPDFAAGAMENAGAITFREYLLLMDGASAPESQRRAFASIQAHELAHHWFGNLVTMPWWDDIWLNEGFATWMAARTVSAVHPEYRADVGLRASVLGVMDADSRVAARKVRQEIESTHDIANAFDGITYQKGAGVLAMFERYVGPEAFRAGLQQHLRAHAHGNAGAADLVAALSRAAGVDLSAPMASFLDQPGVPWLDVELRCPAEPQRPAEVALRQSRYLPAGSTGSRDQTWQIPLCMRYQVGSQSHQTCTLLAARQANVPLSVPGCPDWLLPNADGAGYYRWGLPQAAFEALRTSGFPRLTTAEKLSFADSMRAAFASGALPADAVLRALPSLAADAERAVAVSAMPVLALTREHMLEEAERPALDRYARKLFEPRLRALGWQDRADEDGEAKLLRVELISFLANVIRDRAVRAKAEELGRRYLGRAPGKPESVPVDLRNVAVQVAVQEGDAALFDAVYQRFTTTTDPVERDRLLNALASVQDARSARALALTLDPALRVNEVLVPLRWQLHHERTRAAAWAYLEQNFDAIVARISASRAGGMPGMAASFCSTEMAERVQAFFAPRIERLRGGPRSLSLAVESLRLCAAQVAVQRESARAFFRQQR